MVKVFSRQKKGRGVQEPQERVVVKANMEKIIVANHSRKVCSEG